LFLCVSMIFFALVLCVSMIFFALVLCVSLFTWFLLISRGHHASNMFCWIFSLLISPLYDCVCSSLVSFCLYSWPCLFATPVHSSLFICWEDRIMTPHDWFWFSLIDGNWKIFFQSPRILLICLNWLISLPYLLWYFILLSLSLIGSFWIWS